MAPFMTVLSGQEREREMFENELRKAVDEVFQDFCVEGEDCAIHRRVDRETLLHDEMYGSFITYVGKYCVVTGDNPHPGKADAYRLMLTAILGLPEPEGFPYYEVCVIEVGDGALSDVFERLREEKEDSYTLYAHTFSEWEDFTTEHKAAVAKLKAGELDLTSYQKNKNK